MSYSEQIDTFIDNHKVDMISLLKSLVKVPSVLEAGNENTPYGKPIDDVLKLAISETKKLGLDACCYENRADIVTINDKAPKLAILCHLDVVPATPDGWTNLPFEPTIKDNMIYGRGVSDNKGPAVAALYALYAIKSLGIKLKHNVMLYLGGCEENGCEDVDYYLTKNKFPEYVFTPDGCFPVGNAERGRIVVECNRDFKSDKIISIKSGKGVNIIPDFAEARLKGASLFEIENILHNIENITYAASKENGEIVLKIYGKSTHAAHPSQGVNALTALLDVLGKIDENISCLSGCFPHNVFKGDGLGLDGGLDISITQLKINDEKMFFTADGRVDLDTSSADISKIIEENIPYAVDMIVKEPHYTDENADIVKKLNKIYEEYTGFKGGTYTLDAMTYAHSVEGAVIFGGVIPCDGCANAHGINECYNLNTLTESAKIFAETILEICEME